jgi:uncharacterized tellurite resistance protein B-like protein
VQLLPLTPEQIHLGLCAMNTVAVANRTLGDEERTLLEAVAETLGVDTSAESLGTVEPSVVAQSFTDPDARLHVIQMLVFTAMIDGAITSDELGVIDAFARALGVETEYIDEVRKIGGAHLETLRLDMVRRTPFPKGALEDTWDQSGWKGLWRLFRTVSQSHEDHDLAWRFKRLGLLSEGTLGRSYWAYMAERRFLLPGERGSVIPDGGRHDMLHVLSGYDTDSIGETEVTAFAAGMGKIEDPFALLFGTLCMFHLGLKLRGAPPTEKPIFDAERVARAYRRGLLASVDLTEEWDYWADVETPVLELQKEFNVHVP